MIFFKKINLFAPNPKACLPASQRGEPARQGSKLIFNTPFRVGANVENQQPVKYFSKI